MNWQRYWRYHKRDIIRWAIVVGSALIVAFLAVLLAQVLDKPINSYYPHDEQRVQKVLPLPPFSSIYTFEDEHNQAVTLP